ncbi:MAG: VanZ family protein [Blastocatellia bacterium]
MVETDDKWKRRKWLTAYAPLFIWILVIFYLSSGQGSFEETSRIIRPLLEFFFPDFSPETIDRYHAFIRKLAHPAVYAVLGLLSCRAFQKPTLFAWVPKASLLVVSVAVLDELNQSFIGSRTGSTWDVALDSAGGLSAVFIFWLVFWRRRSSVKISHSYSSSSE